MTSSQSWQLYPPFFPSRGVLAFVLVGHSHDRAWRTDPGNKFLLLNKGWEGERGWGWSRAAQKVIRVCVCVSFNIPRFRDKLLNHWTLIREEDKFPKTRKLFRIAEILLNITTTPFGLLGIYLFSSTQPQGSEVLTTTWCDMHRLNLFLLVCGPCLSRDIVRIWGWLNT